MVQDNYNDNINDCLKEATDEPVEKEDLIGDGEESLITKPFNPNNIDVDIATVNLGMMIEMLANGEIDLEPDFQRASDIWNKPKKSRLIESILLGLPLPSFYFSEDKYSKKLAVIDGLQRLCAVNDFVIKKTLKLEGLQFLHVFEGKGFDDLERPEVRRIKSLKITMNTLRKTTPNEVKYIIFQRVNTAGEPLRPQEMRHALNQGAAAKFIKKMAELESFKKATNYKIPTKRMEDRDFANRFVAFYIGYKKYTGELDGFLNDKMGELNQMTELELNNILSAFDKSMKCCYGIFGDDTFRKRLFLNDRRKPISKAVYDTLSVNVAWLSDDERFRLTKLGSSMRSGMINLFHDEKFMSAVSTATGQKYKVTTRFEKVKELINNILR